MSHNSQGPGCPSFISPGPQGHMSLHVHIHAMHAAYVTHIHTQTLLLHTSYTHTDTHTTPTRGITYTHTYTQAHTWTHAHTMHLHTSHVSMHVHTCTHTEILSHWVHAISRDPSGELGTALVLSASLDSPRELVPRSQATPELPTALISAALVMTGVSLVSWPQVSGLGPCLGSQLHRQPHTAQSRATYGSDEGLIP